MYRFSFKAIGTGWEIDTETPLEPLLSQRLVDRAEAFDVVYSRFRADSLISRMASAPAGGRFLFPDDAISLFAIFDRLHTATDGAVDPLVGRDLELLGYDRDYTLRPDAGGLAAYARNRPSWASNVLRDGAVLTTDRPLVVDVGAVGKGYLVDILSALLIEAGHQDFIVDGSGDMRHHGGTPLGVGLEHPLNPELVIGTVPLSNRAICASSCNRRAWGKGLHHVVDARTGVPVQDIIATWAIAKDAATADGLATALFFAEPERLAADFDFAFVRMHADQSVDVSAGFAGELFT